MITPHFLKYYLEKVVTVTDSVWQNEDTFFFCALGPETEEQIKLPKGKNSL